MITPTTPLLSRRRLRAELRRLRLEADLTQEQVATGLDWSLSKLIRIETGAVSISTSDLRALLGHYRVRDDAHVDEMLELARAARRRTWWSHYDDVLSAADLAYLEYESSAAVIRQFQPMLIPGLLRTEDYTRALFTRGLQLPAEEVVKRVSAQTEQQALLERVNPPQLKVVLDEAVLHRLIGGSNTMRRQLEHLLEIGRQPNVQLQILPFAAGATPALQGEFVHLEFADFADDVVWIESDYQLAAEVPERVAHYLETFMQLERLALASDDSTTMLERVIEDLSRLDAYPGQAFPDLEDNLGNDLEQHFVL